MANKFHTYLVDSIKYESVKEVMKDIDTANLDPDVETIILTITSEGGFLFPAFALYDHIKASKKPVDIIAEGFCMSAAVVIMQAGRKRISRPNTLFMIHPSKNQIQENRLYSEFIAIVEELKRNYELFKKLTVIRSNIKYEDFEKVCNPRKDLNPQEALELGLIDSIE